MRFFTQEVADYDLEPGTLNKQDQLFKFFNTKYMQIKDQETILSSRGIFLESLFSEASWIGYDPRELHHTQV